MTQSGHSIHRDYIFRGISRDVVLGTSRAHSRKPRALRSALWRIRGFANSSVRVAWRAGAWRNTIDLRVSASPARRDIVAGALDLCMGGFGPRRQCWVFSWQDNRTSNDYPLRGEDWSHRCTHEHRRRNVFALRASHRLVRSILRRSSSTNRDRCRPFRNALGALLLFHAIGAALWVGAWVFIATYFSGHTARLAHNTQAVVAIAGIGLVI